MKKNDSLRAQLPDLLTELNYPTNQLFTCINPLHDDKSPSMSYNAGAQQVHCFGCQVNWSIYDVWAVEKLAVVPDSQGKLKYDFAEVKKELEQHFLQADTVDSKTSPDENNTSDQVEKQNKLNSYLTKEIINTQSRIEAPEALAYLKSRGISLDTAKRFKLGYSPNWVDPTSSIIKGENNKPSPRLIIPTSSNSYLARDIRPNLTETENKFSKMKQGTSHLFNSDALRDDTKPIFVVEGEIDAMSVIEVAGDAVGVVGLGSVSLKDLFLKEVKKVALSKNNNYSPTFLIATDNDQAGDACAVKLLTDLDKLNYSAYRANVFFGTKDPNEALTTDREKFQAEVLNRIVDPEDYLNALKQRQLDRAEHKDAEIPTGIKELDKLLNGGLQTKRLYVLGAISGLGKTALSLQIAKNIARNKQDVLYFSLEAPKDEVMERIISSETFAISRGNPELSQTAYTIRKGKWQLENNEATESINLAYDMVSKFYRYLNIIDGTARMPTTEDIERIIDRAVKQNKRPVVFIDYLQYIAKTDKQAKMTDKGAVTDKVAELKKMSAKYDIPVIVISSFNRANYYTQVGYDSFKESGEIEYTADVLWGLQYTALENSDRDDNLKEVYAKASKGIIGENPLFKYKQITLHTLKSRQGELGDIDLTFYQNFNIFLEGQTVEPVEIDRETKAPDAKIIYKIYKYDGTAEQVPTEQAGKEFIEDGTAKRLVAVIKGTEQTIKQAQVTYELHYKPDDQGELIPATDYLQAREKVTKGDAYSLVVIKPNGEKELIAQYDQPNLLK